MRILLCTLAALLSPTTWAQTTNNFEGAVASPIGKTETVSQLKVQFPQEMRKSDSFNVSCVPAVEGFGSWADNNTIWTYTFKAENEYQQPRLAGGTLCEVKQNGELKGVDGKVWKAGTISYSVSVSGPNVTDVHPGYGFDGNLREKESVLIILFDGPVDRVKFFSEQNGYLSYASANAPAEKMALKPVPANKEAELFAHFKRTRYIDNKLTDGDWILATVQQNLIPGSQVTLTVENQLSGANGRIRNEQKFTENFQVRSDFKAEVQCTTPAAKDGTCLPGAPISVVFNGKVKWADIQDSLFIEYIPLNANNNIMVKSFPELTKDQISEQTWGDYLLNRAAELPGVGPMIGKFSDTLVETVTFNVQIEPKTNAKVTLPKSLTDIDLRRLSNAIAEFHIHIGSRNEVLRMPGAISFFEMNRPNMYLPVGIVNLDQTLTVVKSGNDPQNWTPIKDIATVIRVVRAYQARGEYREEMAYTSPLLQMGLASSAKIKVPGTLNRDTFLQFPFAAANGQVSGFYPIEISSPTLEAGQSDKDSYRNPRFVLAQVTDLALHLKKGQEQTVAWVTRLSTGLPVPNARVEIYNCLGQSVNALTADNSGLVKFNNQAAWADDCQGDSTEYDSTSSYFAVAREGSDFTFTHSSWTDTNVYAYSQPGAEYFYSDLNESKPHFHAVVGVNLVKPGQKVPVQLIAKLPAARGFREVPQDQLPKSARIVSNEDSELYYEFPLIWNNGAAEFTWSVPGGSSAKVGSYDIQMVVPGQTWAQSLQSGNIEVAEFKVPLMSGDISFPNQVWIKPDSLPVGSRVRYANGVGAKDLAVELSYYFSPTTIENKDLSGFSFATGSVSLQDEAVDLNAEQLPRSNRPARIEGLKTDGNGALTSDLALEKVADGRSIAEVLKTLNRPQSLIVRARYQDQMGEFQTLSLAKDIFTADQYVGTAIKSGLRTEARLKAAVVTAKGDIITSLADLDSKVVKIETKVIGEEIFGGLIKNTIERKVLPVRWAGACSLVEKVAVCEVTALKEGSYAFEVTAKSSGQVAHTFFKVDGAGRVYAQDEYYGFGDEEDSKLLPLALDKKAYRDGDKAVVSFPSPFKTCSALVTIERSEVSEAFVVANACEAGQVSVPIEAAMAPNVYVSVYAVTGRSDSGTTTLGEKDLGRPTYRLGIANAKVDWSRFKSEVTVTTDAPKYEPGQSVNVVAKVQASEGRLSNGSVTFVVIEEKILELKKNDSYDLLSALMQMRNHRVETATALEKVETVTGDNADLGRQGAARKGGDEGGDGSSKAEFKRRLFDAMVAFQANVPVVNGAAQFSFKTNDSLTRFKVIAIAMDAQQKFGVGEVVYLSEKDTQSVSNIPGIAHSGDRFPVQVNVQNNSGADRKYRTEVTATVKDSNGQVIETKKLSREADIKNTQSSAVQVGEFTVPDEASTVEYSVRIYDEAGKLVDALEQAPQVVIPTVPLTVRDAYVVQVEKGSLTKTLTKEQQALANKGEIQISLAKSLVAGSVGQIKDRIARNTFADTFIESRLYKALLLSSASNPKDLQETFEAILAATDSRGFVKFHANAPRGDLELTANMINAVQEFPWAMKLVPNALLNKWRSAISQVLTESVEPVYVGQNQIDWLRANSVMGRAAFAFGDSNLEDTARSAAQKIAVQLAQNASFYGAPMAQWSNSQLVDYWLLQVYTDASAAKTSPALRQLTTTRLNRAGNAAILQGSPSFRLFYTDETIETAKLLLGVSRLKENRTLARALAVGLVNASQKSWYVSSTLMSVAQGLNKFGQAFEAEPVSGNAIIALVEVNKSVAVDWSATPVGRLKSDWKQNQATVKITQAGRGNPWVAIQALSAVPLTAPRAQGLSVEKEIRNVTRSGSYQAGDLIEVTLKLNAPATIHHVVMSDPIPAGSNIVGEAYGDFSSGEKTYSAYKLYFETLSAGQTTVKFQYQLNNPGLFKLPPTRAEGVYMPSVFGEVPNQNITVQ